MSPPAADQPSGLSKRLTLNATVKSSNGLELNELDCALMKRNYVTSRLLVRAQCWPLLMAGLPCQELLHHCVLVGDGVATEILLRQVPATSKCAVAPDLLL